MTLLRKASVAVLLGLPACVLGPITEEFEELSFQGPVEEVRFDVGSGDLEVRVGQSQGVEVQRTTRFQGARPRLVARVEQGVLTLELDCGRVVTGVCTVDHLVLLPSPARLIGQTGSGDVIGEDLTGAEASTGSGDIEILGSTGDLVLDSGSGDILIRDVSGDLDLRTGSGDLEGIGVRSAVAFLDTGSGDIDLRLADRPDRVDLFTGSGDVLLTLPRGSYDLKTSTGSGDVSLDGVTVERSSSARVLIDTGSGDIDVRGR
jgi:hypothetical protein